MKTFTLINLAVTVAATSLAAIPTSAFATPKQDNMKMEKMMMSMTSGKFVGIEVNGGTVTLSKEMGKNVLRLSKDFMIPKTPSPHFQVIDKDGNAFLLKRITIAGDKTNLDVALPKYIKSVKSVQIWCSFAEVNLGEAKFAKAIEIK